MASSRFFLGRKLMSVRNTILIIVIMLMLAIPAEVRVMEEEDERSANFQMNKTLSCIDSHNDSKRQVYVSNQRQRYVNPLVLENAGRLADPTVIRFKGKYYLYLTGGIMSAKNSGAAVWSSEDLVNWEYHKVSLEGGREITAPTAFDYKGFVYLTGNDLGLFRSRSPLGPFEYFGDFLDKNGQRLERERDPGQGWEDGGVFDPAVFVDDVDGGGGDDDDDDGRVYLYYAGGSTAGVYGVELDPTDLRKLLGTPKHFFRFETTHIWERYGNWNEYSQQSWIEGPWMTKHNGIYDLQYAAPGTDWKTYAVGVYTSKNPLGPFTYYEGSPILYHRGGLINGCAHHSVVEGPGGNLWAIYTLLYRNWNRMFERRIGMDPVGFDEQGNMFIKGPSETPQWAPGIKVKPWENNASGSYPLSEDKNYTVSSEAPGRNSPYAVDNNNRTWWAPAKDDETPWLTLDLGAESSQVYIVDSARILFTLPEGDLWDDYRLGGDESNSRIRKYKIEVSSDGKTFTTVVDKTKNDKDNAVEFDEIEPIECRHVKLTITGWPKDLPLGVVEFTVFGKPTPP
jgi:xylan 1,4-beta-xylosidase